MAVWMLSTVATFMPFFFAGLATLLAWRSVKRKWWLYALLAIFVFAGAQDIGMAPQQDLGLERSASVADLVARDTKKHLLADIVSALLGGLVMWRTAKVFGASP